MATRKKNVFGAVTQVWVSAKGTSSSLLVPSLLEKKLEELFRLFISFTVQWQRSSDFWMELIGYCKSPLWAGTNHIPEPWFLETVSGQVCVTLRPPRTRKQGRVWAGPQPTRSPTLSQGADLEPKYLQMPTSPLFPTPCLLTASGTGARSLHRQDPAARGAGPKVLYLSWLARPQFWTRLQVPVTPPLWSWGERVGTQIKPREAAGGGQTRTWVSADSPPATSTRKHPREPQPTHLPSHSRRAPPPPRARVLLSSVYVRQASASVCQAGWASRWRRPASWCAAPARWAAPAWCPARSSIFRATVRPRCPWSSSWTLVSWEVGLGRGAGVGELP